MAVSFPSSLSSATQAAGIQEYRNANAASTAPALRYRYPQKSIGKDDDYLEIGVIKYVPPGFDFKKDQVGKDTLQLTTGSEKNSNIKADYTIQLPIPANIGDTNQVNWGSGDVMNSLAAYGAQSIGGVIQSGELGKGTINALKSAGIIGIDVLTRGGGQGEIVNQFTSALVNVFGANTTPEQLRSRATGSVLNPNLELLFGGVNLRSFTFDFDFAPRNSEESNVVKQIIRIFKQSMAPKTGSNTTGAGLFIQAPNVFLLKYKTGSRDHPYLNKFKPCALTNMGMNYTGSGSYTTYADKTPVHMKLSMSFTELNPIYNEDYNSSVGKQAVGY
jgi:hypothetical protein